jgi:RNase P subunit RPR2
MTICPECGKPGNVCGVEIQGVYDGILFWRCLDCGHAWQRWEGIRDDLARAAAGYILAANGRTTP